MEIQRWSREKNPVAFQAISEQGESKEILLITPSLGSHFPSLDPKVQCRSVPL